MAAGTVAGIIVATGITAVGNTSLNSNRPVHNGPIFVSAVPSFQIPLAHNVAAVKPARSIGVIWPYRSRSGVHHEAFDRRSPRHGRAGICRPDGDQPGCRGDAANKCAEFSHERCDRFQRATHLPAPLSSLRLSPVLSALLSTLLLRTALLLSAVSVLRAGTVHVRLRLWSVLVMEMFARKSRRCALHFLVCGPRIHGAFTCLFVMSCWERHT